MRVRVRASSRLHFGLLRLASIEGSRNERRFGGVGLMVRAPELRIAVQPSKTWTAHGPLAERALEFAKMAARGLASGATNAACAIHVEQAPPPHSGLGAGTQLALAVSRAVATLNGAGTLDGLSLAALVGRGARSAIGIHGFAHGGFLVDGGKGPDTRTAPLLARCDFPDDWRILLVVPHGRQGAHGAEESQAFAQLNQNPAVTDALCRLVLLGMLPALHEHDLAAFGEAVFEFNRRVGEMFRPWQGGGYAH